MDEDVAGLNSDDNPAPEEVDAAVDEAIEDRAARRTNHQCPLNAKAEETPSCPRTSRRRQLSRIQATVDYEQRARLAP